MLLAWKSAGVLTYAGYILGFPNDTVESIMHDIDVIKRELPVDLLEFFYLTPLPGSEDHLKLFKAGAPLDPDMNKYDLNHICTTHPKMSRDEWDRAYKMAWQRYYTIDHVETILRRVAQTTAMPATRCFLITWFMGCNQYRAHPSARKRPAAVEISPRPAARFRRSSRSGRFIRNILPRWRARWCAGARFISGCAAFICASSTIRSDTPTPTWP